MRYYAPHSVEFYRTLTARIGDKVDESRTGYGPYTTLSSAKSTGTRETYTRWDRQRGLPKTSYYIVQQLVAQLDQEGNPELAWKTVYHSEG